MGRDHGVAPVEECEERSSASSVDYARRLYADVLAWYRSAESKAQVILTLDGIFLGAVTGLTLGKREDVAEILHSFGFETSALLVAAGATLGFSIVSAVMCLFSRTYTDDGLRDFYRETGLDPRNASTYAPEAMWFFQHIAGLEREQFQAALASIDADQELRALGSQIHILSSNVTKKHEWVNRAFLSAGLTLIMLLALIADYAVRVS